jgi:hypothetical protein
MINIVDSLIPPGRHVLPVRVMTSVVTCDHCMICLRLYSWTLRSLNETKHLPEELTATTTHHAPSRIS